MATSRIGGMPGFATDKQENEGKKTICYVFYLIE